MGSAARGGSGLAAKLKHARQTGKLNLSQRSLQEVPDEIFHLDELVRRVVCIQSELDALI